MNILFYIDPWIEMNLPNFRYQAVSRLLGPIMKALTESHNNIELVCDDFVKQNVEFSKELPSTVKCTTLDCQRFPSSNYLDFSLKFCGENFTAEELKAVDDIFKSTLKFEPDIILVWESASSFFKHIYPGALVLNMSPGMLSRPPFPYMINIDPQGFYNSAFICEPDALLEREVEPEDIEFLSEIESSCFNDPLSLGSPFTREELDPYGRFDKIFLVPLQVSRYFAFDSCCEFKTQFELAEYILKHVPSHIGVIVANYKGKEKAVNDENYLLLRKNYPNLIYRSDFNEFEQISQLLLPLVDGVITVSSSMALQAAFLRKEVFIVGKSQYSFLSSSADLTRVGKAGPKLTEAQRTSLFDFLFSRMQFTHSRMTEEGWLLPRLECALKAKRNKEVNLKILECFADKDPDYRETIYDLDNEANEKYRELFLSILRRANYISLKEKYEKIVNDYKLLDDENIEVVSFDIFDTLVERKVICPKTVFTLMNKSVSEITKGRVTQFDKIRPAAEQTVFRKIKDEERGEVKLDEIYDFFVKSKILTSEEAEKVKQLEVQTEIKSICPRDRGIRLFQRAKKLGKRIILMSDMYLPQSAVEEILKNADIVGYDKLYMSCEYDAKKANGRLFKIMLQEENIAPNKILHIGDNEKGDVVEPEKKGIKSFHLIKGKDHLFNRQSVYYKLYAHRDNVFSPWESIYLGLVSSKFYSDQNFVKGYSHFNGDLYQLGYAGIGPVLAVFAIWLAKTAKEDGKENLFFLSREGLVIKKIFDTIAPYTDSDVKSFYLHSSRSILRKMTVETPEHIYNLTLENIGKECFLKDFVFERFGIIYEDIPVELLSQFPEFPAEYVVGRRQLAHLLPFTLGIQEYIFEESRKKRTLYARYLDEVGFTHAPHKAVVDLGYLLTVQTLLCSLCKDNDIGGYYLATYWKAMGILCSGIQTKSLLGNLLEYDYFGKTMVRVPILEVMVLSDEGTMRGVVEDHEGKLRLIQDTVEINVKRVNLVSKIHAGAVAFANDLVKYFGDHLMNIPIDPQTSFKLINDFYFCPGPLDGKLLEGVIFENSADLCGVNYMVEPRMRGKDPQEAINKSMWKQGARALWTDQPILNVGEGTLLDNAATMRRQAITIDKLTKKRDALQEAMDSQKALLKERTLKLTETYRAFRARDGFENLQKNFEAQRELLKERTEKLVAATRALREKEKAQKEEVKTASPVEVKPTIDPKLKTENEKLKNRIKTSLEPAIERQKVALTKQKALLVERTNKLVEATRQLRVCEQTSKKLSLELTKTDQQLSQKTKLLIETKKQLAWYEKPGMKGALRRLWGKTPSRSSQSKNKMS